MLGFGRGSEIPLWEGEVPVFSSLKLSQGVMNCLSQHALRFPARALRSHHRHVFFFGVLPNCVLLFCVSPLISLSINTLLCHDTVAETYFCGVLYIVILPCFDPHLVS